LGEFEELLKGIIESLPVQPRVPIQIGGP
jgi:hypothetical protein